MTVNFQPDRRIDGVWLLERLAADGWYRSRFEIGYASGAVPVDPADAERAELEHEIFGGWYDGATPWERPKYGALDFRRTGFGAAPWYGSAHFRFSPAVLDRCTFCYPDSAARPSRFGTSHACDVVRFAEADLAAGVDPMKVYVEAHIHGPLSLGEAEALVLDPSFRGTAVNVQADALDVPVEWNAGLVADIAEVCAHPEFRGQSAVDLATALAVDGVLTPACLTAAAESGVDQVALRRVWLYLVRFGRAP